MMTQNSTEMIDDYLGRLRAASWPLGESRAVELVDSISEHIRDAVAEFGDTPHAVAGILERLGPPERIAQDAADEGVRDVRVQQIVLERPALTHETWAVGMLTVGSFGIPFIGWIAGVVLLLTSRRWLWWEKLLGVLIVPGGPLGALLLLSIGVGATNVSSRSCTYTSNGDRFCSVQGHATSVHALGIALAIVVFVAPIAVNVFLWMRAKRRVMVERDQMMARAYSL